MFPLLYEKQQSFWEGIERRRSSLAWNQYSEIVWTEAFKRESLDFWDPKCSSFYVGGWR
jgi:hypothetical protein